MKRFILTALLLALPATTMAQVVNWTVVAAPASTTTVAQGGTATFTFSFTPSAVITAAALDIELHDPNGNKLAYPAQSWTTPVNSTAGQTVTETLTWSVPATAVLGKYSVVTGAYRSNGTATSVGTAFNNQYWNLNAGSFTVTAPVASATTFTPTPPVCWPKPILTGFIPDANMVIGQIPAAVEAATGSLYDHYGVWACTLSNGGYQTQAVLFNYLQSIGPAASYLLGAMTPSAATAAYIAQMKLNGPYTPSEQSFVANVMAANRVRVFVIYGASASAPVYGLNPDGTVNMTPVSGEGVSVGTACDETTRVLGTDYFSVAGAANSQAPGSLPVGSYADCVGTIYGIGPN